MFTFILFNVSFKENCAVFSTVFNVIRRNHGILKGNSMCFLYSPILQKAILI